MEDQREAPFQTGGVTDGDDQLIGAGTDGLCGNFLFRGVAQERVGAGKIRQRKQSMSETALAVRAGDGFSCPISGMLIDLEV